MPRYDAVLFDLLTALLDSWTLWNGVAGGEAQGLAWRQAYLRRAYAAGAYVPYEALVHAAARDVALPAEAGHELLRRWDELAPWPEAPAVLRELRREVPLAVVTNCSESLGARAIARVGAQVDVAVTAERAGFYKPDARTYSLALRELGVQPARALFVAGSPGDVAGAAAAGMQVVWHDRLGLALPPGAPAPLAHERSLEALLRIVRG